MAGGRRAIEINEEEFEKLCAIQCTVEEIACWFRINKDTVDAWCKRTYGAGFSVVYEQKRKDGFVSVRRGLFQLALKGNLGALIYLSKNYLGMRDKFDVEQTVTHTITAEAKEKLIEDVKAVLATITECQKQPSQSPSLLRLPSLRSASPGV
jgi:hypothetical protein